MSGFEMGKGWKRLSEEEKQRKIEEVVNYITQNTGYRSKKEKAKQKRKNGTLSGADSRKPNKNKGNRPGATRVKIKRKGNKFI